MAAMPLWSNGIRELLTKLGLKMLVDWFNDFATWMGALVARVDAIDGGGP
jgi:hypothetical protein